MLNKTSIPSHRTRNLFARGTHLCANQLYRAGANSTRTACHPTLYARYWWTTYSHSKKSPPSTFSGQGHRVKVDSLCARFIQLQIPPYRLSPALRRAITWLSGMLSPLPLLLFRHLSRKRHRFRPNERSSGYSLLKDFLTYGLSCLVVVHRL